MSTTTPLRYVSGSVVYGASMEDAFACFEITPQSSDYDPVPARLAVQRDLGVWLHKTGRDGQIVRMARLWNRDAYLAGRRRADAGPSAAAAARADFLADHEAELRLKCVESALPRVFFGVRLTHVERDLRERLVTGELARTAATRLRGAGRFSDAARAVQLLRRGLLDVGQRERDQLVAQELLAQLHEYPSLRSAAPASTAAVQWWVRRVYCRGTGDPDVDDRDVPQGVLIERDGVAAVRPLEVDLLRWTGGVESGPRRPDHVVCTTPDGRTVVQQTMMATSWHDTGDRAERGMGIALVAPRGLDWPIDLSVTWEWHSNGASRRAMDRQSRETLEDARQEHGTQLGVSDGTSAAYGASQGLLKRLEATGEPTLRSVLSVAIAVEVDDEDNPGDPAALKSAVRELRSRSRTTRDLIEQSCGVVLQVPPLQQVEAMQQMLPAQGLRLPGYGRIVMPDQVAAQAWSSGTSVGSLSGWVFARTATRRPMPVRLDLSDPARLKCAAGVLWVGDSGGGKTFAVGAALVAAVFSGARVVNDDPKGDHKWMRALPTELVQEIRLQEHDALQHGMLDPFVVAAADRRTDVALSFLRSLLRDPTPEMTIALQEAVAAVESYAMSDGAEDPTCWHVLERLQSSPDPAAKLVHRSLSARAQHGLARLAFARPGERRIALGDRAVTSIVSNAFMRPQAGVPRSEWSDLEVVSMGLTELVGHLTARLTTEHRAELKILNSDEAHASLATDLGRGQINAAQRMGRSELLVPSIATQAPSDLTDANLKNLFGAYLLFRAMDRGEAEAGLILAGLQPDDEIIERLVNLPTGQALMRDHRGRTEWIDVLAPAGYLDAVSERRALELADDELVGAH